MSWYFKALKNYAGFRGRAGRKEFWFFTLYSFLATIALLILDLIIFKLSSGTVFGMFSGAYSLGVIIPTFAVAFRRLHDTGKSGWWLLINFVPVIGILIIVVLFLLDSQPGDNRYGSGSKMQSTGVISLLISAL